MLSSTFPSPRALLAAAGCTLLALPAAAASRKPQQLIPANFSQKTDSLGFIWDINQQGVVNHGTNYCFSSAQTLQVNGNNVYSNQPMMTADGSEFVLACTNTPGVTVTRRIKVDVKAGAARYVDIFTNPGGAPLSLTVGLYTNLNSNCQAAVTDTGKQAGGGLGKKDCGILAVQTPGNNMPSVVFYLAGARSKTKPTVTISHNRSFQFTFNLTVPAGKSVSILTGIAQRRVASTPDARALAAVFKPFRSRKWTRDLPADVRRTIVNLRGSGYGGGEPLRSLAALEALGVARCNMDVLALGEQSRITGTAACAHLAAETRYGEKTIPFEKVAALVGDKSAGGRQRVLLRDGQVLGGRVAALGLKFTMSSGLTMHLGIETLDRLVTRALPDDGRPADEVLAWIKTAGGDRLALARPMENARLSVATPWGCREIPLDNVRSLGAAEPDGLGYRITLKDGSRFFTYLEDAAVELDTLAFGAQRFGAADIRSLEARQENEPLDDDPEDIAHPHLALVGGSALVGRIDLADVGFVTMGEVIRVPPDQIRIMHNTSAEAGEAEPDGPVFSAELWGDGTVVGRLLERALPVRVGDEVWLVPAGDVLDVFVPTPTVPDALRVKIAALIRDLGHPEWEARETATRELNELGYVAKAQLTEAERSSTDPEVRKRARDLLDELRE
jgi:hypothetical protein